MPKEIERKGRVSVAARLKEKRSLSKVAPWLLLVFVVLVFIDGIGVGLWLREPKTIIETEIKYKTVIVDPYNVTIEVVCENTKEVKNVTTTSTKSYSSITIQDGLVEPSGNVIISGKASTYSRAGCIGCSKDLRMANGEPLSDEINTVALTQGMYQTYKNKTVVITNTRTGLSTEAKVTDTGGFGAYGRVADLSLSTSNAVQLRTGDVVEIRLKE